MTSIWQKYKDFSVREKDRLHIGGIAAIPPTVVLAPQGVGLWQFVWFVTIYMVINLTIAMLLPVNTKITTTRGWILLYAGTLVASIAAGIIGNHLVN